MSMGGDGDSFCCMLLHFLTSPYLKLMFLKKSCPQHSGKYWQLLAHYKILGPKKLIF